MYPSYSSCFLRRERAVIALDRQFPHTGLVGAGKADLEHSLGQRRRKAGGSGIDQSSENRHGSIGKHPFVLCIGTTGRKDLRPPILRGGVTIFVVAVAQASSL